MGKYVREVDPDQYPSLSELDGPHRCKRCKGTLVINARTAPEACPDCVDPDQMTIDDLEAEYHEDAPMFDEVPAGSENPERLPLDWFIDAEAHELPEDCPF
jgi:hypothetical protein